MYTVEQSQQQQNNNNIVEIMKYYDKPKIKFKIKRV